MAKPFNRPRSAALLVATLGLLSALGDQALARTATQDLADCSAIALDQARLACYDRVSGRAATTSAAVESAPMEAPAAPDSDQARVPAQPSVQVTGETESTSMIAEAWGFNPDSSRYGIDVYRPNYLLLASYSSRKNNAPFQSLFDATEIPDAEMNSTEAEFQVSFKTRLWATEDRRFGVWAAYTQHSQWQVYNAELSRPFRETNYMPELMVSFRPGLSLGDAHWRLFNFGYTHQSNGRADPISRSWDRLIAQFGVEWGNLALLVRPWLVIDDGGDDNPDITDYYGHGDITAIYKLGEHRLSLMARGNLDTERGAARFSWTSPPLIGPLRGYVQAFTGYGESMIDYNWKQNVIGVGFTLNSEL
jgi:phospholipase A1